MAKRHNYPGGDQKFRIINEIPDFFLSEHPFHLVIKNQMGQVKYRLTKNDCFWDSDGNYYFCIEHVQEGRYEVVFSGSYEDDDYNKQNAVVTDRQVLTVAGRYKMPFRQRHHLIHYEQVWTVSIDGDDYLCGSDGKYILTSDGKRICFKSDKAKEIEDMGKVRLDTMTGEEFKQFIEGYNPDGHIDTVPEMMRAAQGISDDETIQHDVNEQIEEYMDEECATNADIDEMF